MRPELENTELIERYLQGQLGLDDLKLIEQRIKDDSSFAEEVDLQRLLMEGATNDGLRKILDHIHYSEYDKPYAYFIRVWWRYIAGGTLVLIGLLLGSYYLIISDKEKNNSNPSIIKSGVIIGNELKEYHQSIKSSDSLFDIPRLKSVYGRSQEIIIPFREEEAFQYFFIDQRKDTLLNGTMGTKIKIPANSLLVNNGSDSDENIQIELKEIYKKSDIVLHDFNHPTSDEFNSSGKVYIKAEAKGKDLKIRPDKKLEVEFNTRGALHVSESDFYSPEIQKNEDPVAYYKIFEPLPERRIIILPAVVLDYDVVYTRNDGDKLMNERMEALLLPEYENAFTSTTQFHYRIEGCQLYGKSTELIDIYLNNIHLKLWEADSLVEHYLLEKASVNCTELSYYMKAAEYFRWLKSLKHGKPHRYSLLDYRNYRKGQLYNKLPDKTLEKYLSHVGLSASESDELINYFKKMFYYKKMFYKQVNISKSDKRASLDYYYKSEGKQVAYPFQSCDKNKELASKEKLSYLNLAGNSFGGAMELNQFMSIDNFGWINHESFINFKKTCSLSTSVVNYDSAMVSKFYVVFKDFNSVMGGKWSKDGKYYFERLPKDVKIWIVVLGYKGTSIFYAKKEVLTGSNAEELIEMKQVSEQDLEKDLQLINQ